MRDGQTTSEVTQRQSLADMITAPPEPTELQPFTRGTWIQIVLFGVLVFLVFRWQMPQLVEEWTRPNWSHGPLIPLFSLYLLWSRRLELQAVRRRTCLWGLPILIFGLLWQIVAYYPVSNNWLGYLSVTVVLFGLVLYLAGPQVARLTWLPIFYLAFAMPMPKRLYTAIAVPLQEFAALCSAALLKVVGVKIDVVASHLQLVSLSGRFHELTVAEACSGVRSLMAFVAIGVAIAYLENRPAWQRVVLVGMTVPIAILINVIRVAITCGMYVVDKAAMGQGFMHEMTGLLMLIPAFMLLWGVGWLLQHLFIEVEEEDQEAAPDQPAGWKEVIE